MKKIIYAIFIALLCVNAVCVYSQPAKVVKNITNRIDSVNVSSIADSLNTILNDTIMFISDDTKSMSENRNDNANAGIVISNELDATKAEMNMINVTVISSLVFVLLIIVIALVFGYMRRRAKYKLIEKAIDGNYPLPEYLFNKKGEEQWGSLRSGIVFIAVGLGLMFAFDDSFMSGVFLIVLIIGIGKIVVYVLDKKAENKVINNNQSSGSTPVPPPPPTFRNNQEPDNLVNSNNASDNDK